MRSVIARTHVHGDLLLGVAEPVWMRLPNFGSRGGCEARVAAEEGADSRWSVGKDIQEI